MRHVPKYVMALLANTPLQIVFDFLPADVIAKRHAIRDNGGNIYLNIS
jgi:hypothetical protein